MIGRRTPTPGGDPTSVRLAHATTARQDQAVARIDELLRQHGRDRRFADAMLDIRIDLRPSARP